MSPRTVRIGGASGFWGDSSLGAPQLAEVPGIDYIVFDYLAELTMSVLAGARAKNPELGYATDFVEIAARQVLKICRERGIRLIANAGGVNPAACARALEQLASDLGARARIAVVDGDDVLPLIPRLRERGIADFYTGGKMPERIVSANAYLGALPIARALALGADVVVTGRVVDSAVTLGALVHEFGWKDDEHDRLAAGSLAGHLIECGCQATGGLFTDWKDVPDWANMGYPVLECEPDGRFVITKPENTGGLVSVAAVAEQMLYEIGDPANYVLPDVVCDFSRVQMEAAGPDRVRVRGARGKPPTDTNKVSATYADGFRCVGTLTISGFEAAAKARRSGEAILERTRAIFGRLRLGDYSATDLSILGTEAAYGPHARPHDLREAVMR
ncbi:MAG TPA: acyclic terpene utilization AtuA family protein, partial [Burkholderiales bacterium]|nr:acyclic terpene utilization AtuA family protein [Burkholderiales bacterium]